MAKILREEAFALTSLVASQRVVMLLVVSRDLLEVLLVVETVHLPHSLLVTLVLRPIKTA
jgi:hypothetical protein